MHGCSSHAWQFVSGFGARSREGRESGEGVNLGGSCAHQILSPFLDCSHSPSRGLLGHTPA